MVTFQVTTDAAGRLTVLVNSDSPAHPDLLDELATRTAWLFAEAYAQLPDDDDAEPTEGDDGGVEVPA